MEHSVLSQIKLYFVCLVMATMGSATAFAACTPLNDPALTSPCAATEPSNAFLDWEDVADEMGYYWEVYLTGDCGGTLVDSGGTGSDVTFAITVALPDGDYTWSVQAIGDEVTWCTSGWMPCCDFTVSSVCTSLLAPAPSGPCATTVPANVNLNWTNEANNSGYEWFVYAAGDCDGALVDWGSTGPDVTNAMTIPLSDGNYDWNVMTLGDGSTWCDSLNSACCTFTVTSSCSTLLSPATNSPCATTEPANVNLTWTNEADETGYEWFVYAVGDCDGALVDWGSTGPDVTSAVTISLSDGNYDWNVRTLGDGSTWCDSLNSVCCSFAVASGCSVLPSPVMNSPCPSIEVSPVSLEWNNVANNTGYDWAVFAAGDCYGAVVDWGTTAMDVTMVSTTTLPDASYEWTVIALGNGTTWCDSAPNPCCAFTVNAGSCSTLTEPSATSPISNPTIPQTDVTLSWNNVSNEDGYEWEVFSGPACAGSNRYAQDWAAMDVNSAIVYLPNGSYSWRVRAAGDGTNYCDSTWTLCEDFTVSAACTDVDGDTFTPCTGDCNDSDEFMSPGDPEICGDFIDNNCNGTLDDPCGSNCTTWVWDDFESGPGSWTATGLWHMASNPTCAPMANSGSTSFYYGINAGCTFDTGVVTTGRLTSPVITGLPADASLNFWFRRQAECGAPCAYDRTLVQVTMDGGTTWNNLIDLVDNSNTWVNTGASLSAYAGQNIQISFLFNSVDNAENAYFGWAVDDVRIEECATGGTCTDYDGDGQDTCSGDCDDWDLNTYTGAPEICGDGKDNNCDTNIDEGCAGSCMDNDGDGWNTCQGDCDDMDNTIFPYAAEICSNAIDENCNGMADDACTNCVDNDADAWTNCDGDCDDNNDQIHPGMVEVCQNGIDDNCNGMQDDDCGACNDDDLDGYTTCEGDCNDFNDTVYPFSGEVCGDGLDNNCNGYVDENCGAECPDNDLDGFTTCQGDCNDWDNTVYPGATEICFNALDDNCSGMVDEGCGAGTCLDADFDGWDTCAGDCNDSDDTINPDAFDICGDQIDNNCNGWADENCGAGGCPDNDGDGFTVCQGDCDDWDEFIYPGATEYCDYFDNNCDGIVDESCGGCPDNDGDGYTACNWDCDDNNANLNPGMPELCNDGLDNNCNGQIDEFCSAGCTDGDGDGYTDCMGDCADGDINTYPGAPELCDGVDNNCDAVIDEGCGSGGDNDGDGFTTCEGDCDDWNLNVYPGATENCDWIDNDCDGMIDEGCAGGCVDNDGDTYDICNGDCNDDPAQGGAAINPGAAEICDDQIDNNCNGLVDEGCGSGTCPDNDGDGYTTCDWDCDDWNLLVYPGNIETCNGLDDNCNGEVDEGCGVCLDNDLDGWGTCQGDCNDNDFDIKPYAPEICFDQIDNNCNGLIDEGCLANCTDNDLDGWTTCDGDCNDWDNTVYPGLAEVCGDWWDNNCNGFVDEGCGSVLCPDNDADGFTVCQGDCNDWDDTVYPNAPELLDQIDNDCDGVVDDGFYNNTMAPWEPSAGPNFQMTMNVTTVTAPTYDDPSQAFHIKLSRPHGRFTSNIIGFREIETRGQEVENGDTYNMYTGDIGNYTNTACPGCYCWIPVVPNGDGTITMTINSPDDGYSYWYIISASNTQGESSMGRDSDGNLRDSRWLGERYGANGP